MVQAREVEDEWAESWMPLRPWNDVVETGVSIVARLRDVQPLRSLSHTIVFDADRQIAAPGNRVCLDRKAFFLLQRLQIFFWVLRIIIDVAVFLFWPRSKLESQLLVACLQTANVSPAHKILQPSSGCSGSRSMSL